MTTDPYASPVTHVQPPYSSEGAISQGVLAQLAGTKPWVRFFSVMMFVGAGLMLLGAVVMGGVAMMGKMGAQKSPMSEGVMMGFSVGYGLFALVYIYPAVKLWKYASGIGALLISGNMRDLESALSQQRSFWKFVGIMMIVIFVLYFVFIIAVVGFGTLAGLKAQGH